MEQEIATQAVGLGGATDFSLWKLFLRADFIVKAVILRVAKSFKRKDGTFIKFDDNAAAILEEDGQLPRGSRIFGPIPRELRDKGFMRIISLAPEVL